MTEQTTPSPERRRRARKMQKTRRQKLDAAFAGKKFIILREIHLAEDERFETPFGQKARHGYALQEVGNEDNKFLVGIGVLRRAALDYQAVELPTPQRVSKRFIERQKLAEWRQTKNAAGLKSLFGWDTIEL